MTKVLNFLFAAVAAVFLMPIAWAQSFDIPRAENEVRVGEPTGPAETVELRIGGEMRTIRFVTDDQGNAIYQGDIDLGPTADLRALADMGALTLQQVGESSTGLFGLVATRESAIWEGGLVPFRIDASVPDHWIPRIRQAIRHWEEKTPIRFKEQTSPQGQHVLFFDDPVTENCQTGVGRPRLGRVARVQLAEWCQWGNIVHEIGHVLGMHHEHARQDRKLFIDIVFTEDATQKTRDQFEADPAFFADLGDYCYDSIVHYGRTNAAGTFVITPKAEPLGEWTGNPANMGQRRGLADCDIATILALYDDEVVDDAPASAASSSGFEGDLAFFPDGCESDRHCNLVNALRFNASDGRGWEASARDPNADPSVKSGTTDGASIPSWAQPVVGLPFDPNFIKPAVIHDHYSYEENRVRSWWSTQRVFYQMLSDQGVPQGKARIMYLAVLIGSQKWIQLVPGDDCGQDCINDLADVPNINFTATDGVYREWDSTYDTEEYDEAMRLGIAALALHGDELTLEDINVLAGYLIPDHPIFRVGEAYAPTGLQDSLLAE